MSDIPELSEPVPPIIVLKTINPPRDKLAYAACLYQTARGELVGLGPELCAMQWTGETAEEASEKLRQWWYRTYDLHKVIVKKGVRASGRVWIVNRKIMDRRLVKPEELDGFLARGYVEGTKFTEDVA